MSEPIPIAEHPSACGCTPCVTADALRWLEVNRRARPSGTRTEFDPRKVF